MATTVKMMLTFEFGLCISFSGIVIPALTGKSNEHNAGEFIKISETQASWLGLYTWSNIESENVKLKNASAADSVSTKIISPEEICCYLNRQDICSIHSLCQIPIEFMIKWRIDPSKLIFEFSGSVLFICEPIGSLLSAVITGMCLFCVLSI